MTHPSRRTFGLMAAGGFALQALPAAAASVESGMTARTLTSVQQGEIRNGLARFAPIRVDVIVFGDTKEIMGFGDVVDETLQHCGWKTKLLWLPRGIAFGVVGVSVYSKKAAGAAADEAAAALANELRAHKVSAQKFTPAEDFEALEYHFGEKWDPTDVGDVLVHVGLKPP